MAEARDAVILNAKGKPYVIETEDGLPANTAAHMLEEMREIRTWAEIEQMALNEKERQEELERDLICIWCGDVRSDSADLEAHEDQCR